MSNKILGLAAGLIAATLAVASTIPAHAAQCSGDISNNPCAAYWKEMALHWRQPGHVVHRKMFSAQVVQHSWKKVIVSTTGTVTFYVKARQASPIVMYAGEYSGTGAPRGVIRKWGSGAGWFSCGGYFCKKLGVTESELAHGIVTFCGVDGHNTFHQNDVDLLMRIRHDGMGDTANMFGNGGGSWFGWF